MTNKTSTSTGFITSPCPLVLAPSTCTHVSFAKEFLLCAPHIPTTYLMSAPTSQSPGHQAEGSSRPMQGTMSVF